MSLMNESNYSLSVLNYMAGNKTEGMHPFETLTGEIGSDRKSQGFSNIKTAARAGMIKIVDGIFVGFTYGFGHLRLSGDSRKISAFQSGVTGDRSQVCDRSAIAFATIAGKVNDAQNWVSGLFSETQETAKYYPYLYYRNRCNDNSYLSSLYRVSNLVLPIMISYSKEICISASAALFIYSALKLRQLKNAQAAENGKLVAQIREQFINAADALKEDNNRYLASQILNNMKILKQEILDLGLNLSKRDVSMVVEPLKNAAKEIIG